MRLNLAANELNPFLVIVAVGLLILDLTCYLGISVSQQPVTGGFPHAYSTPAGASPGESFTGDARN